MKPRVACARILAGVLRQQGSLNTQLPAFLPQVPERDTTLVREICYGTLRHQPALAVIAGKLLDKPLKEKDSDILALVLCGLYQLREMRIPSHAALNETVGACQTLKKPWARGLVNGVLRRYLREQEAIDAACADDDRFRTAHPRWLQQRLAAAWGEEADAIMAANNQRPPMTLRVNRRQSSRQAYLDLLEKAGATARPAPFTEDGIYLETPCNVTELPGFAEGQVSVQDEAAQLCAGLLDLQPGQRVLDGCAAPGGKTCHILEHQPALAALVAVELEPERMARIGENLTRLGLEATLTAADASDLESWWDGVPFDRILLDAPCSATGVIRRHPDIKVLRRAEDIDKLAATQTQLLAALWSILKPGGRLLYATCSVLPEENDRVVAEFLRGRDDCSVVTIAAAWGRTTQWGRQLFPVSDGHDGFYYAVLAKTNNRTDTSGDTGRMKAT